MLGVDLDTISIHIVGCGAVGRQVAMQLAVTGGFGGISLYDYDKVDVPNLGAQGFRKEELGQQKVAALAMEMARVNPDQPVRMFPVRVEAHGGVLDLGLEEVDALFLCVDDMDARLEIVNQYAQDLGFFVDGRLGGATMSWLTGYRPSEFLAYYQSRHFTSAEAEPMPCAARSFFPVASALAAEMIMDFAQWTKARSEAQLPPPVEGEFRTLLPYGEHRRRNMIMRTSSDAMREVFD